MLVGKENLKTSKMCNGFYERVACSSLSMSVCLSVCYASVFPKVCLFLELWVHVGSLCGEGFCSSVFIKCDGNVVSVCSALRAPDSTFAQFSNHKIKYLQNFQTSFFNHNRKKQAEVEQKTANSLPSKREIKN